MCYDLSRSLAWIRRAVRQRGVVLLLAVPVSALAQPVAGPGGAAGVPMNLLDEAARSVGVKQCLPAIARLSALAVAGARQYDVLVDWNRPQPDAGPFFSLMGVNYGSQSVAATITAIPQGDGCTVAAERISVAPYTCQSIAQVELRGYVATSLLPSFTVYTIKSDPGASVSLIDSPPMCLVIRRHVQFGWREPASAPAPNPAPGAR